MPELRIRNGIAYAGKVAPPLAASSMLPLNGRRLKMRFNTGEERIFDFTPLLNHPAFAPLADEGVFHSVRIEYGVPTWNNGEIDIAPGALYSRGVPAE